MLPLDCLTESWVGSDCLVFLCNQVLALKRTRRTGLSQTDQRQGTCKTSRSYHGSSQRTCWALYPCNDTKPPAMWVEWAWAYFASFHTSRHSTTHYGHPTSRWLPLLHCCLSQLQCLKPPRAELPWLIIRQIYFFFTVSFSSCNVSCQLSAWREFLQRSNITSENRNAGKPDAPYMEPTSGRTIIKSQSRR